MKYLLHAVCLFAIFLLGITTFGQDGKLSYSKKDFVIRKTGEFTPSTFKPTFNAVLKTEKEAPTPGGESYKSFLMRQKQVARQHYLQQKNKRSSYGIIGHNVTAPAPIVEQNYGLYGPYIPQLDTAFPIRGGNPLDNTMAISNDGMLMVSVNSIVYAYDLNADTAIFKPSSSNYTISFQNFASSLNFDSDDYPFDPKLLYDPNNDRFVMTFLAGRTPSDSRIVVGFSSTNNPGDTWYMYEISGNPRSLNEWTDYPAIAITENDLFYTVNLIDADSSWQAGFRGSIIWQVPLEDAFSGVSSLPVTLWDDVKYDGKYTRNLCPVEGGAEPLGPNMYFLSNRNFDVQNDSIFLIEVTDRYASGNAEMNVKLGITNAPYGMPPNGRQEDTDPNESGSGLQTNDSRMLGAILHNGNIQYVGNTMNFNTGFAAVYHGKISNVTSKSPTFEGTVIGDSIRDYGYPNIAFTGTDTEENETIIAFNHTSPTDFAGVSCVYYSDCDGYSDVMTLKEGDNYVDQLNYSVAGYERWGDYFGIQRLYNEPGKVWTSGFYGLSNNQSSIWMSEISAPVYDLPTITLDTNKNILGHNNIANIMVTGNLGATPYQLFWNGDSLVNNTVTVDLNGDVYTVELIDAENCKVSKTGVFEMTIPSSSIYPNPFGERFSVAFQLNATADVEFMLIDNRGRIIKEWEELNVASGKHQFSFSTTALETGIYHLIVTANDKEIINEQLIKVN